MTFPMLDVQLKREYILMVRDALLKQVDAYERMLGITPRTSELRQMMKDNRHEQGREALSSASDD